jgi:hypothetical protein
MSSCFIVFANYRTLFAVVSALMSICASDADRVAMLLFKGSLSALRTFIPDFAFLTYKVILDPKYGAFEILSTEGHKSKYNS